MRNGAETARKMMIPPIVGVPAFAWWPSGPSSRMCWPNSRTRRKAMKRGLRKTQMSRAAVPPIRTSPTSERLGDRFESDASRGLDEHGVALGHELLDELGGGGGVRDSVVAAHARGQRAHGDEHVGALARVCTDLLVEADLVGTELEHVAEHRDTASRRARELVEGGAHRHRVGVVAVVEDDRPVVELDALPAAGGELDIHEPARVHA